MLTPDSAGVIGARNAAGLAVSTVYQVGYTLPQYQQLVGSHLQRGGASPLTALAALAAFGVVIVTHTFVQVVAPNRELQQVHAQSALDIRDRLKAGT